MRLVEGCVPKTRSRRLPHKVVRFSCVAEEARSICLAGSFNNWNPNATPMTRSSDGEWIADLVLSPGYHEYVFVVDGQWYCDVPGEGGGRSIPRLACDESGTLRCVNRFKLCHVGL